MCRVIRKRIDANPPSATSIATVFQLHANESASIPPKTRSVISTGIIVEPSYGYVGLVKANFNLSLQGIHVQDYVLNQVRTN